MAQRTSAEPTATQPDPNSPDMQVPPSACQGILWPALPRHEDALVLSLQYQLDQSQWWSPEVLEQQQLRQFENLLFHTTRTVPFYSGRFQALASVRRGELTMDLFRRVPLLHRTDIQNAGESLFARQVPKEHGRVAPVSTSGSTGRPITIRTTELSNLFFHAINTRYHIWHGRDFMAKTAALKMVKTPTGTASADRWVPGYKSGPMVALDIRRPVTEQLAWLEKEDPVYLLTYPSNLKALIEQAETTGFRPVSLRGIATLGEVLDPELRGACERLWSVSLTDAYSCQEAGMIALQCPEHPHYHVQSESLIVEILDADGNPCRPGEIGRVVLTDLHNFATPLIRYESGDYAEVGEPCACGRGLPVINRVMGRTRNMLTLPNGDKIWPIYALALHESDLPIRQIQLIQKRLDAIEVRLVTAQPLSADQESQARRILAGALGEGYTFTLVYLDEIPLAPNGKFEEVRSELDG